VKKTTEKDKSDSLVLEKIEKEVKKKLQLKNSWKRIPRRSYMRFYKMLCHKIFPTVRWKKENNPSSDLGVDEFGRDVFTGMEIYVGILKKRGIKIHAVIVQGSRSKGKFTPKSDIDVTIIANNLHRKVNTPVIKRILGLAEWFRLSDYPLFMGVEPSGCSSPEDFLTEMENLKVHALDALYYGMVVYDDGFWLKALGRFKQIEAEKGLQRLPMRKLLFPV
jgi:predicted nucleotidyltransferase